jgi:hypothetical protein
MTERHPLLPNPHLETVPDWHPVEGTPATEEIAVGCSAAALVTRDPIGSGNPKAD